MSKTLCRLLWGWVGQRTIPSEPEPLPLPDSAIEPLPPHRPSPSKPFAVPQVAFPLRPIDLNIEEDEPTAPTELLRPLPGTTMPSIAKKYIIDSILSVFETGSPTADYGAVVFLDDGAGITYGKHQSTDASDTLDAIVMRYIDLGGKYSQELLGFNLAKLEQDASVLADHANLPEWVRDLMALLEEAGDYDPVMRRAQDEVFDELYWLPAQQQAQALKLVLPLSWLVIYDSTIHSGPNGVARIRKLFPELPPSLGGDEQLWVVAYLRARRNWLASHSNPVVQRTTYRIDAMLRFVELRNWNLDTPIHIDRPRATIT